LVLRFVRRLPHPPAKVWRALTERADLAAWFDEFGTAARDAAGRHACIDQLEYRLGDEQPPWTAKEHWQAAHHSYVEDLGPDAVAIGPPESLKDWT
jgi:uncharacterized protein YndB with AHSA1/START domain